MGMTQDSYVNFFNNLQREEIPNNTDKRIDFDEEMKKYKKRTEKELPFTMTLVSDASYLDQFSVITLEYHCY